MFPLGRPRFTRLLGGPLAAALVLAAAPLGAQRIVSFPTRDGGVTFGELRGEGDHVVVLVHGGRFTKESWREQAAALNQAGLVTLAIDLRGRGRSAGGAPDSVHLDVLAAVGFVKERGTERVSVVGASLGGWAAARATAELSPGEIDRLVLLAHAPIEDPERLHGKKLFIVTRGDVSGSGTLRLRSIRDQYERSPHPKELVVLDGSAHAQHVFATRQGPRMMAEIEAFLTGTDEAADATYDRAGLRYVGVPGDADAHPFWIGATEVTVRAFDRFVAATGHRTSAEVRGAGGVLTREGWENRPGAHWRTPGFEQTPDHPVVLVSWNDADGFCRWSGGRLPMGREWEAAARHGSTGTDFVWGDHPVPRVDGILHANVADASAAGVSVPEADPLYDDGAPFTAPVGSYAANSLGGYDLAGNVLEWTTDREGADRRVARGGAWNNPPGLTAIARRSVFPAAAAMNILGFRCARDAPSDVD